MGDDYELHIYELDFEDRGDQPKAGEVLHQVRKLCSYFYLIKGILPAMHIAIAKTTHTTIL